MYEDIETDFRRNSLQDISPPRRPVRTLTRIYTASSLGAAAPAENRKTESTTTNDSVMQPPTTVPAMVVSHSPRRAPNECESQYSRNQPSPPPSAAAAAAVLAQMQHDPRWAAHVGSGSQSPSRRRAVCVEEQHEATPMTVRIPDPFRLPVFLFQVWAFFTHGLIGVNLQPSRQ
jgi:hypothetical protein